MGQSSPNIPANGDGGDPIHLLPAGERFTWGLVLDLLDGFEKAGFHRCDDDQKVGHAIELLGEAALAYCGERA